MHAVEVSGNAKLADAVMLLARNLRWDYEDDLSRVFGDIAAHRIAGVARDLAAWQADIGRRLAGSLADYLTAESGLLASRAELESFAAAAARLRDDLERLEQRVRRLG
jgi:ubiquinone biosynthesis protein UbiJ